jgi:hypothetical protein
MNCPWTCVVIVRLRASTHAITVDISAVLDIDNDSLFAMTLTKEEIKGLEYDIPMNIMVEKSREWLKRSKNIFL